jgi:septal ring factor EnvC (AmiA/AmiB activator)
MTCKYRGNTSLSQPLFFLFSALLLAAGSLTPLWAVEVPENVLRNWKRTLSESEQNVTQLENQVARLNEMLRLLKTNSQNSAAIISELRASLQTQETELATLRTELEEIENAHRRQSKDLLTLQIRAARLSKRVSQLNEDYANLTSRYDQLSTESINTLRQTERRLRAWKTAGISLGVVAILEAIALAIVLSL